MTVVRSHRPVEIPPSLPAAAATVALPSTMLEGIRPESPGLFALFKKAGQDVSRFFSSVASALADRLSGRNRLDEDLANLSSDLLARLPTSMRDVLDHLPNVGTIGGNAGAGRPAVITSREFGDSSATPAILEVPVARQQEGLLAVGKKAHEKFFADYPPFDFNVNFSCARATGLRRQSDYADPRSHWHNVFFGRYQIDTPVGAAGDKEKWTRPFGFKSAGSTDVNFEDITRIGNADWGYFSNWMYGVPEAELDKAFAAQKTGKQPRLTVDNPRMVINGKEYVECTVDGIMLPSAFVGKDGKKLTNNDKLMSPVWRAIFGKQAGAVAEDPALAGRPSFAPTEMKMKFYLRAEKRDDPERGEVFSTLIYGGGINKSWAGNDPERQAFNERFLDAQMAAVRATMP